MRHEDIAGDPDEGGHAPSGSLTRFRDPIPDGPFVAVLGGSETRGRRAPVTFCEMADAHAGPPVVNMGVHNAGIDVFLHDDAVLEAVSGACATVIQVMGAHALSNRFYTVHPRRNDRFLRHSRVLGTLYGEVDFTEFAFVRHMLTDLRLRSADKFALVVRELEAAWIARMRLLLHRVPGPRVLLWLRADVDPALGREPLFVTEAMMDRVAPMTDAVVTLDMRDRYGGAQDGLLDAEGHAAAARALTEALAGFGLGEDQRVA